MVIYMAERTKRWIADKMKELMKKKPINRIRISEICDEAEIDRSTFYYHFKDKYALVAWIFYDSARSVDVVDFKTATQHMNQMKNDILFYKKAFEDTSQNALWQYMLEYFAEENVTAAKSLLKTDTLDPELCFEIRFYCYGAVGTVREWILKDGTETAERIVRMIYKSMPLKLRQLFYGDQAGFRKLET